METITGFLVTAGIRTLEAIFVLGVLGSAVVFILSTIEDLGDIFTKDVVPGKDTD
jgi:hypothetical protein